MAWTTIRALSTKPFSRVRHPILQCITLQHNITFNCITPHAHLQVPWLARSRAEVATIIWSACSVRCRLLQYVLLLKECIDTVCVIISVHFSVSRSLTTRVLGCAGALCGRQHWHRAPFRHPAGLRDSYLFSIPSAGASMG